MESNVPLYPVTPDAKGRARKKYKGRDYYFGAHGTPESYQLFATWSLELRESGTPPTLGEIRAQLDNDEDSAQPRFKFPIGFGLLLVGITAASAMVCGGVAAIYIGYPNQPSGSATPIFVTTLDGVEMTDIEKTFLRRLRESGRTESEEVTRFAGKLQELMHVDFGPDKIFLPTPDEAMRDMRHGGMSLKDAVEAKRKRLLQESRNPQIVGDTE